MKEYILHGNTSLWFKAERSNRRNNFTCSGTNNAYKLTP